MDPDNVEKMGLSPDQVTAMIAAWLANQQAWRDKLVANGRFEWFLFYGGQQTAPGQNQTCGQCTCQSFLEAQCAPGAGAQEGTLFYGYSRSVHTQPWPLPTPDQDLAMFLLARGPYAFFGYGWSGCASATRPFTRPPSIDREYGAPLNNCSQTAPGSGVWARDYSAALVLLNDPTFIEAARKLAELAVTSGGTSDDERITFLWKRVLSRPPAAEERTLVKGLLTRRRDEFRADPKAAGELLAVGIAPLDTTLDPLELAAWTSTRTCPGPATGVG